MRRKLLRKLDKYYHKTGTAGENSGEEEGMYC